MEYTLGSIAALREASSSSRSPPADDKEILEVGKGDGDGGDDDDDGYTTIEVVGYTSCKGESEESNEQKDERKKEDVVGDAVVVLCSDQI